ncbi:GntR family transcriptional regulator [Gulosibacter massiliensis]|uniref:GntR family transcriptional regulator n=1 Tax=Gulosibacter massiliensis TaxID=2479839 RepID=UPI000F62D66F|nr:GntR family transcriptional regulator [Gulosibacter massiliensis]
MSEVEAGAAGRTGSVAQWLAAEIKEEIFDGSLAPGEPIREVQLSSSKAVSRRTVREALLMLASQGLVVHERNRGATVRRLGASDVRDLYAVRRTLETQGARNAPFATPVVRDRLSEAYSSLQEAAHRTDSREMVRADLRFHGAVVGLSGSPRLDGFYAQVSPEMEMALSVIRGGEVAEGWSAEQVIADHRTIFDALMERDVLGAQQAILAHIEFNERYLLGLIDRPSS